jgi:hypothetical protein
MTGIIELKRRLAVATDLFARTTDPIEKSFLGGDVRELERLFEIALGPDLEMLLHRRP